MGFSFLFFPGGGFDLRAARQASRRVEGPGQGHNALFLGNAGWCLVVVL